MLNGNWGWIVGIVCLFICTSAAASEKTADIFDAEVRIKVSAAQTATDKYIAGLNLFEQDRFEAAAKAFRDAYRISTNWKILYYIGKCEIALKRYGVAFEVLEAYWESGRYTLSRAREKEIRHTFERLQKQTGVIEISGMAGADIFVDGQPRGVLPLSKRLFISSRVEHTVLIRQGETVFFDGGVRLAVEEELSIAVSHGETTARVLDTVRQPVRQNDYDAIRAANHIRRKLRSGALGALGTGALAMAGSLVTGVCAKHEWDALVDSCGSDSTCVETPPRTQAYRDAESAAGAATVLFVAGATMIAVGTVLLAIMKRKSKEKNRNHCEAQ